MPRAVPSPSPPLPCRRRTHAPISSLTRSRACSRSSAAMSLRPCVKMATGTRGSRACKRERLFRARRDSGWPATRPALRQPACPQLCALTLKTTARQRTRADPVGPEMPERLAQLAPCRHVDDLDKVDDRKRADHALARPALFITVRDHELALLADGPAHQREVQVLRFRRAPSRCVQADVIDRLLGAMRQNAGRFCQGSRHRPWPTRAWLGIGLPLTAGWTRMRCLECGSEAMTER